MIDFPHDIPNKVEKAIFLCHGYGSSGEDMAGLIPDLKKGQPNTAFFCPHAPQTTAWGGYEWFSLDDFQEACLANTDYLSLLMDRIQKPATYFKDLVQSIQNEYHLKASNIILGGFSQGGLIALYAALTIPNTVAGVIGMSAVPILFNKSISAKIVKEPFPILLTHGAIDPVVPIQGLQLNIEQLQSIGLHPQVYIDPSMEHGISENCLREIERFLNQVPSDNTKK